MNWAQVKDRVSHMCLDGDVVASWSLTQDVAGSSPFNDKYFLCATLMDTGETMTSVLWRQY